MLLEFVSRREERDGMGWDGMGWDGMGKVRTDSLKKKRREVIGKLLGRDY